MKSIASIGSIISMYAFVALLLSLMLFIRMAGTYSVQDLALQVSTIREQGEIQSYYVSAQQSNATIAQFIEAVAHAGYPAKAYRYYPGMNTSTRGRIMTIGGKSYYVVFS
jgi:hypothetical protein